MPWNAGGAFVITALGLGISEGNLENLLYIPLAFACWLSPLIGLCYAALGYFSPKISDAERALFKLEEDEISLEQSLAIKDDSKVSDSKT